MNDFQDLPYSQRKRERKIAEKLVSKLLFGQKIKFRFVKKLEPMEYGRTEFEGGREKEFWKNPVKPILISETNFRKSKYNIQPRKMFIDTTNHELAHASEEVRFHPDFNPYSTEFEEWCDICGEPHIGEGHDRVWHDKYLEFKKRAKKEKFIKNYLKGKKKEYTNYHV